MSSPAIGTKKVASAADEFWWLPEVAQAESLFLYLAHDPAVKDEVEPLQKTWYYSLDARGQPCAEPVLYPTWFLVEWMNRWMNQNIHRSLALYTADGAEAFRGPFLVDVDNSAEDIEDALKVTRCAHRYFVVEKGMHERAMRVFFSGRKGFHIEVEPSGIEDPNWRSTLNDLRAFVKGTGPSSIPDGYVSAALTVIDPQKDCVRLAGSLNAWLDDNGGLISRRRMLLSCAQLADWSSDDILRAAQQISPSSAAQ